MRLLDALKKQADQGDRVSQFVLGRLYEKGSSKIPLNTDKALNYFKQSASNGFARAYCKLGDYYCYVEGKAKSQSQLRVALVYYEAAALLGNKNGAFNAGVYYQNGYGCIKDPVKAAFYYYIVEVIDKDNKYCSEIDKDNDKYISVEYKKQLNNLNVNRETIIIPELCKKSSQQLDEEKKADELYDQLIKEIAEESKGEIVQKTGSFSSLALSQAEINTHSKPSFAENTPDSTLDLNNNNNENLATTKENTIVETQNSNENLTIAKPVTATSTESTKLSAEPTKLTLFAAPPITSSSMEEITITDTVLDLELQEFDKEFEAFKVSQQVDQSMRDKFFEESQKKQEVTQLSQEQENLKQFVAKQELQVRRKMREWKEAKDACVEKMHLKTEQALIAQEREDLIEKSRLLKREEEKLELVKQQIEAKEKELSKKKQELEKLAADLELDKKRAQTLIEKDCYFFSKVAKLRTEIEHDRKTLRSHQDIYESSLKLRQKYSKKAEANINKKKKILQVMEVKLGEELFKAARQSNIVEVRYRLYRGDDPNWRDENGMTLLHYACLNQQMELIKLLLDNPQVKTDLRDNRNNLPYEIAFHNHVSEDVLDKLADICQYQPLHRAVLERNKQKIKQIISQNDVLVVTTARDRAGKTPLDLAQECDAEEILIWIKQVIKVKREKLFAAAQQSDFTSLIERLNSGIDPNWCAENGETLYEIAFRNHAPNEVLDKIAGIYHYNSLHRAVLEQNNQKVEQILKEDDALAIARDCIGKTAFNLATTRELKEIVRLLSYGYLEPLKEFIKIIHYYTEKVKELIKLLKQYPILIEKFPFLIIMMEIKDYLDKYLISVFENFKNITAKSFPEQIKQLHVLFTSEHFREYVINLTIYIEGYRDYLSRGDDKNSVSKILIFVDELIKKKVFPRDGKDALDKCLSIIFQHLARYALTLTEVQKIYQEKIGEGKSDATMLLIDEIILWFKDIYMLVSENKLSGQSSKEYDLHLMSKLPDISINTNNLEFEDSYIWVESDSTLYYMRRNMPEKVTINDINLFKSVLKPNNENNQHLTEKEIKQYITSNGDHIPGHEEHIKGDKKSIHAHMQKMCQLYTKEITSKALALPQKRKEEKEKNQSNNITTQKAESLVKTSSAIQPISSTKPIHATTIADPNNNNNNAPIGAQTVTRTQSQSVLSVSQVLVQNSGVLGRSSSVPSININSNTSDSSNSEKQKRESEQISSANTPQLRRGSQSNK